MEAALTAPGQESTAADPCPERDPELGLRDLTGRDYLIGTGTGIVLAAVLNWAGTSFGFDRFAFPLTVIGFGMGFLGYLDQVTRLILNRHTAVFAAGTVLSLGGSMLLHGINAWVPALAGAAGAFFFLLILSAITNFAGGGDIKLAPVPAAVLTACFPLAGVLWLQFTFILCLIGMVAVKLSGTRAKHTAMGPFMALALIPAVITGGLIQQSLGLA